MANGGMIKQLKELAEKDKVSSQVAYPLIFAALAEIIEKQEEMNHKFSDHEERQKANAMIIVGEWLRDKPRTILGLALTLFFLVQALGPALVEQLVNYFTK